MSSGMPSDDFAIAMRSCRRFDVRLREGPQTSIVK
jgi:hypothetical protein